MTTFLKWYEWITISEGMNERTRITYSIIMGMATAKTIENPVEFIYWVDFMNDI